MMVKKKSKTIPRKIPIPFGVKLISIFLIITGILLILIGLNTYFYQLRLSEENAFSHCSRLNEL